MTFLGTSKRLPSHLWSWSKSGRVRPCKTIDLGCGAGNYAIYLASVGFDVTGVDISPSAIALAQASAERKGVTCRFVAADILGGLDEISETFEFAYDWCKRRSKNVCLAGTDRQSKNVAPELLILLQYPVSSGMERGLGVQEYGTLDGDSSTCTHRRTEQTGRLPRVRTALGYAQEDP